MAQEARLRFGILPKLLIAMASVSAIPLLIVWYIDYQSTMARINRHVSERLDLVSDALVAHVDDWVEMNYRMLHENAALPDIRAMEAEKQNPILKLIRNEYDWSYLVITVDRDGRNIGRSDDLPARDYADRIYVKQVLNGEAMGREVLISRTTGLPAFVLSVPIRGDTGQLEGVLAVGMSIVELSDQITNARIGETGYAFLVDENGKVIAHQSREYTQLREDFSRHPAFVALMSDNQSQTVYEDDVGKKAVASMKLTGQGWVMVVQQDHDEAFRPIEEANRSALILLACTLALVTVVASVISHRLTGPIRRLTVVVNEVSVGNFEALDRNRKDVERRDEIGALARAIDRLAVSVRMALSRLRKNL